MECGGNASALISARLGREPRDGAEATALYPPYLDRASLRRILPRNFQV
jgi:hypothetical protein